MAVATAVTFVWLGMVLAIPFLEAPLKFRAPDVTIRIGLGIGRIVFRALNIAESVFAVVLVVSLVVAGPSAMVVVAGTAGVLVLIIQLAFARPRLAKRSDRILAGEEAPRSHAHLAFIALECAKTVALVVTGVSLVSV